MIINNNQTFGNRHPQRKLSAASAVLGYTPVGASRPFGSQGYSVKSVAVAGLKLADKIAYGRNGFFQSESSEVDKVGKALDRVHTAGEVLRPLGKLASHAGSVLHGASEFAKTSRVLKGLDLVTDSLSFFKDASTGSWQAVKDIAAHKKRGETQTLLQQWNAESGRFQGSVRDEKRLRELVGNKEIDLTRSRKKTVVDRLTDLKNLMVRGLSISSSALVLAKASGPAAAKALPVVALAANSIAAIQSGIKTGIQVSALRNLNGATRNTDDELIHALAGHIKKERTIEVRKGLIQTGVSVAGLGVSTALAATLAGIPVALLAVGALSTACALGTMAFESFHNRKLKRAREQTTRLMASGDPLQSLAKKNIGVAERAFLMRLRSAQGEALNSSVRFLRDLGVTDNTIKKLQLAPEGVAMMTLQQVLYKSKLKLRPRSHISGLSVLGGKNRQSRVTTSRHGDTGRSLSQGMSLNGWFKPLLVPESTVITHYRHRRL